jgi:hypothetical protein
VKDRIVIWAIAGFLVASGWGIYFSAAHNDHPMEPIVSSLLRLTCPIAIVGMHYPVSLNSSIVANIATYALVGLMVETLRRQLNHSK